MLKIKFTIITLFIDSIRPYLESSMMWKATKNGLVEFEFINLRDFGIGPHRSVDDTPYGGGDGMLLRCEPVFAAIESVKKKNSSAEVILPTPAGMIWDQSLARQFAGINNSSLSADTSSTTKLESNTTSAEVDTSLDVTAPRHYVILCPHYEGFDHRILSLVDHQISLGRYILTGGELPALIIIDSIVRLIPGVLGGATSAHIESFSDGNNLEYPQYTKPSDFRGLKVPEILLSGNHSAIRKWRDENSSTL